MKTHTLVFATHNNDKTSEIRKLIPDWIELKSLNDIGYLEEIAETGTTLEQNALIKAYKIYSTLYLDCFADDTGLEVEALNGAPGVYSARYSGVDATYSQNTDLLLQNLQGVENRKARFRTVIYLIFYGKKWLFEGVVNGTISHEKRGIAGFGYDPVFIPEGQEKTFAEMSSDHKNQISHRGRALQKMLNFLQDQNSGTSLAGQGTYS